MTLIGRLLISLSPLILIPLQAVLKAYDNMPKVPCADSDPALRDALQAALDSGKAKVQGVTVKVGVPASSKTGIAEFKVEPWTKK